MNTPKIVVPADKAKVKQQIAALEWQIKRDTRDIDREIHQQALQDLKRALD